MIEFESAIKIKRSKSDVFSFVADQENNPKWNYYITQVRKTSKDPLGAGTTFYQTRKEDSQELRINKYEPPDLISIETIPPSKPELNRTIEFHEEDGVTLLNDIWKLDTGHPKLLQSLFTSKIKSAVKENLLKLKELLETGSTTLQDGRQVTL